MYEIEYMGHPAALIVNGEYLRRFRSTNEAKEAADNAEQISVNYPPKGRRAKTLDMTEAVRQSLDAVPSSIKL